jgi:hypothetical protein
MKHKKWEKERNENEVAKLAMENERRQWILEKQKYERMKFYQQLEESKKKLAFAQTNLQKGLEDEKNHKLKKSAKVGFILDYVLYIESITRHQV